MMTADETIDRLYGLPLAEFTQARNAAATELRKAGDREAAGRVKALRRPTAGAAAVNRLVRQHRGEVEEFLRASAALRDAQLSGKGDLAVAKSREREELEDLTGIGGEAVRQTLLAAAVDDDAARQLLEARLERELEARGFGTLLAHAPAAAARPAAAPAPQPEPGPPERKMPRPDDSAARARLQETEAALRAARVRLRKAEAALGVSVAEERDARRRREQAQRDLEDARGAVEHAERDLGGLPHRQT